MTLEEIFQETQQNLIDLAAISDKVAKAREEISASIEVTGPADAHARMAEAMQAHQTLYLGVISRQLLWLQRAFLEQWRGFARASVVDSDDPGQARPSDAASSNGS